MFLGGLRLCIARPVVPPPQQGAEGADGPSLAGEAVPRRRRRVFYGWYMVALAFLSLFVSAGAGGFTFSIMLPAMHASLGWSRSTIVLGSGISGIVAAVVSPWIGRIMDRRGPRLAMVISMLLLGASLGATGLASQPWEFYVSYGLVSGASRSALGSVAPGLLVAQWFVRRRATAYGLAASGPPASNLVLPPLLAAVVATFGWRAGWFAMGLLPLVLGLVPTALFVRRRPEDLGLEPDGGEAQRPRARPRRGAAAAPMAENWAAAEAFHHPAFWLLAAGMALILLAPNVTTIFVFSYLADRGLSPGAAAATISALSLLQLVSRIVVWMPGVGRFGVRGSVLVWGTLLCLACALMATADSPLRAITACGVLGLAMGGNLVLQLQIWPEYFGRAAAGAVIGMGQLVQGLSQAVVPLAFAALLDRTGSFTQMYAIVTGLVFAGLLLHLKIGRPIRRITALNPRT